MQTISKPTFSNYPVFYTDRMVYRALATWLFTILIALAGLKIALDVLPAVLMKLYELLIQRNPVNL